jgi:eukaryotic-like serine/threonine-protein kinase
MIGKIISHYEILEKLGEGGMGVVYKAHDTKLDRIVALKFLPSHIGTDETEKKRFINEARAASILDHSNICTIHSIEETNEGNIFIVMAYYEGMSLKAKIEQKPLPIKVVVNISIQIASGLQKAHTKGIIHRDLKPANIFITNDDHIKIIDFGLAKVRHQNMLTKSGSTLGTVPYMSPEQAQGVKVDHRTDIWSMGVVIYEMITGQHPFKSDYETALVYSIINEEPEPITAVRSNVPMELERIVRKALQKDRNFRYQSVEELIVDLNAVKREQEHDKSQKRAAPSGGFKSAYSSDKGRLRIYFVGGAVLLFGVIIIIAASLFLFQSSSLDEIRSIAVLPLTNLSGDSEQEYFSDGMTEALITDLAGITALRVISRTSMMQYKGVSKPLAEIARELDVDAIVEGTVMRSGLQVRITAQLIDAKTERHLWTNSYTRELQDILLLQSEVARAIADEIKITLTPQEHAHLTGVDVRMVNTDAYEAILKGRYFWNQRTPESLRRAIHFYEQAIAIDPEYADAYRGLGSTYMVMGVFYGNPEENFPKARAYIEKALQLDGKVLGGNLGLGAYNLIYKWDWPAADRYLSREVELHPAFDHVNNVRGIYLASLGREDEAIVEFQKALRVDPLSLIINADFGNAYYMMRQYDQAIVQCQRTIDIDPNFILTYIPIAAAYAEKGEYEKAISILVTSQNRIGVSQFEGPSILLAELAYVYAKSGRTDPAIQILQRLKVRASSEYIDPYLIALVYIALEDNTEAFAWLEKAREARSSRMLWLDVEPKFDPIRSDPRFKVFREKIGFIK